MANYHHANLRRYFRKVWDHFCKYTFFTYLTVQWKEPNGIGIERMYSFNPKREKLSSHVGAYRLITLSSNIVKLLERIIEARLRNQVVQNQHVECWIQQPPEKATIMLLFFLRLWKSINWFRVEKWTNLPELDKLEKCTNLLMDKLRQMYKIMDKLGNGQTWEMDKLVNGQNCRNRRPNTATWVPTNHEH